ncbi:HECT-like ubiquitin-conjugating enzyme-binding-domain-containing protein [Circinella umbellata]|nr:HECT-like ubiquitin-conjugating enzyme-binding-domain-containing protein [Circinella umbellata]
MVIPFFSEQLANINAIRSTIAIESTLDSAPEKITIKNNSLCFDKNTIVDFDAFNVQLDPRVLTITSTPTTTPSTTDNNNNIQEYDIKLVVSKPIGSNKKYDDDLKTCWTAKELQHFQGLSCRSCHQMITSVNEFQSKDLPSEHWYELVECWICHEAKPEEHRSRMQPITARSKMVLVGGTYLLLHPQDLLTDSFTVDDISNIKWDTGLSKKWIPIHCTKCQEPLGEGQYEQNQEGETSLLATKFYKYCISILPMEQQQPLPTFMEFLLYDLFDAAKAHATYRFIIQGRKTKQIYALLWLFNWDTHIIYNRGFLDKNTSNDIYREHVMKVLYIDCTQEKNDNKKRIELWSNDKTTDHLIYPESCCELLLKSLEQSTKLVPPSARLMNNPAMTLLHNFSVGFIKR